MQPTPPKRKERKDCTSHDRGEKSSSGNSTCRPTPFSLRSPTETEVHRQQRQLRKPSEPAHPLTNPIVPRGGFLQVAVSEAPLHTVSTPSSSLVGASDTASIRRMHCDQQ